MTDLVPIEKTPARDLEETAWSLNYGSALELLTVLALIRHTGPDNDCQVTQSGIGQSIGVAARTVTRLLERLEARGYIHRRRLRRSDGKLVTTQISLSLPGESASEAWDDDLGLS